MKGYKYFLDTNIFLRVVFRRDPIVTAECEQLIEKIKLGQVVAVTSSLVIAEVFWVSTKVYSLNHVEVIDVLNSIRSIGNLKFVVKSQVSIAIDLFIKHNIKFADCLIASNPEIASGKISIVSYDKDFDKLGVKRVEPIDILSRFR